MFPSLGVTGSDHPLSRLSAGVSAAFVHIERLPDNAASRLLLGSERPNMPAARGAAPSVEPLRTAPVEMSRSSVVGHEFSPMNETIFSVDRWDELRL